MTDDIVKRLQVIECSDAFSRNLLNKACAEIERLRELSGDAGKLREERDEARRKICEIESQCICDPPRSPQKYASLFGWDCYKENTDDR